MVPIQNEAKRISLSDVILDAGDCGTPLSNRDNVTSVAVKNGSIRRHDERFLPETGVLGKLKSYNCAAVESEVGDSY